VGEDPKPKAHHDFDQVIRWLYELRATGYYGEIEMKWADGKIVAVLPRPLCKPGEELPVFRSRARLEAAG
jgi:hypothetical protein